MQNKYFKKNTFLFLITALFHRPYFKKYIIGTNLNPIKIVKSKKIFYNSYIEVAGWAEM